MLDHMFVCRNIPKVFFIYKAISDFVILRKSIPGCLKDLYFFYPSIVGRVLEDEYALVWDYEGVQFDPNVLIYLDMCQYFWPCSYPHGIPKSHDR